MSNLQIMSISMAWVSICLAIYVLYIIPKRRRRLEELERKIRERLGL